MSAFLSRVRGQLRLARGRCPACASEAAEGCSVCLGHLGPFPVEPGRQRRWAARFEASLAAPSARVRAPAARQEASQTWASV